MKKIKDLKGKCKYSAESVYIFTELGNKSKRSNKRKKLTYQR